MIIPAPAKAVARCLSSIVLRFANRRFFFAFTAVAVWGAKIIHIHDHHAAVHPILLRQWGYSFVAQDIVVLTLIRLLLEHWIVGLPFALCILVTLCNGLFMLYNAAFSIIFVSFYFAAGSEIHLRNVSLPTDPSSRALILSGSLSFAMVLCLTFASAWLLQNICYCVHGYFADVVNWPLAKTWHIFRRYVLRKSNYSQVPQMDIEDQVKHLRNDLDDTIDYNAQIRRSVPRFAFNVVVNVIIYTIIACFILMLIYASYERPIDRSLIFLSWTAGLIPFVDLAVSSPVLQNLPQIRDAGIHRSWDNKTALSMPPKLDWLPKDTKLAGFEDWYDGKDHYNADADPLKISNLDQDVLSELKDKLQDVPVRHVLLLFLESTRHDVFPLKKQSVVWNRLVESFGKDGLPPAAMRRLATLTPTANFITGDYDDGFDHLKSDQVKRGGYEMMSNIGFPDENVISSEYLRSENATHGAVDLPNLNAFAFQEDPLEDYIRDAFVSAKEKNERVFLSHITSTSHHAFKMPETEEYIPVAKGHDMLSHYINTQGYDDKWLRKILNLLDEQGVANETLVVFVGDHGLSLPENDVVSPYYNPNVGVDHVPLVLSHPLLPAFDVDAAVHASQIVPTILDILLETGSLNNGSRQVASDMVRNFEGQSLIRPQVNQNETTGQGNWQFTIVNPGRAVVTARDARYPERHLAVPLIDNIEWRFTNLTDDPLEENSIQGFEFGSFIDSIGYRLHRRHDMSDDEIHAIEDWVQEGASVARWWAEDHNKRWRFGPYAEFTLKDKLKDKLHPKFVPHDV
ncbi:hypothetical protein ACLX1H_000555 [Fusarium chlamydosporum]